MAVKVNLRMAAAAILDFVESEFLQQNRLWDTVFSQFAKLHAKYMLHASCFSFKMAAAAILDFLTSEI